MKSSQVTQEVQIQSRVSNISRSSRQEELLIAVVCGVRKPSRFRSNNSGTNTKSTCFE